MNAILRERVRVDANHSVALTDVRLEPGQLVEVIVQPDTAAAANASPMSLWSLSASQGLDAPEDYSVNFEQALR